MKYIKPQITRITQISTLAPLACVGVAECLLFSRRKRGFTQNGRITMPSLAIRMGTSEARARICVICDKPLANEHM